MNIYTQHSIKKLKDELTNGKPNDYTTYFTEYHTRHFTELAPYNIDINSIGTTKEAYDILLKMCGLVNGITEISDFKQEIKLLEALQKEFSLDILCKQSKDIIISDLQNENIKKEIEERNAERISPYKYVLFAFNNPLNLIGVEKLADAKENKDLKNKLVGYSDYNIKEFISQLKNKDYKGIIILINDITDTEIKKQALTKKELERNGFICIDFDYKEKEKDLFTLTTDENEKEAFYNIVLENEKKADDKANQHDQRYDLTSYFVNRYLTQIKNNKDNYKPISTETKLDKYLDGGFYEQQVILITAKSGVGKTTFCLQLADNMAKNKNQKVLYFALEQPKDDLISKSLSRLYLINNYKKEMSDIIDNGKEIIDTELREKLLTMRDIKTGRLYKKGKTEEEAKAFDNNFRETFLYYTREITPNLNIFEIENSDDFTIESIEEKIKTFKKEKLNKDDKLIVFLDYLQIMRLRGKESFDAVRTIDYIVAEIKRIAREHNLVLIAISCNNREGNKSGEMRLENMRGSAIIEYTADIGIGIKLDYNYYASQIKNIPENKKVKMIIKDSKGQQKEATNITATIDRYLEDKDIKRYTIKFMKNRNYKPLTITNMLVSLAYNYYELDKIGEIETESTNTESLDDLLKGFNDME